ncbi:MAG: serine protease [Acetobacteraceae bacterium]|nr:serine protease [Acetobacteraceae bacterium]
MRRAVAVLLLAALPAAAQPLPTRKPEPLPYNPFAAAQPGAGQPGVGQPGAARDPGATLPRGGISSGTAFAIGPRLVLTNAHVIRGCRDIRLRTSGGAEFPASRRAEDPERDLALLVAEGDPGPALAFRRGPPLRRGEGVVTYGFPLAGLLSSGPTLTTGEVSALSGLRDNPAQIQISAPVQPGNSGGPLLDRSGLVAGIVTSKLNAQRVAQVTGDIPQNVNFAIKGEQALAFLRENGVTPRLGDAGPVRDAAAVGEAAHDSTLLLRCQR